jgi:hypothetical protein
MVHDTPVFATTTVEAWLKQVGAKRCPYARELLITADAGRSNSYGSTSGSTSYSIEHRLLSFMSMGGRSRPLRTSRRSSTSWFVDVLEEDDLGADGDRP